MSRDFYIKDRDKAALDHVEKFGFITTRQAKNIFYGNYEVARRRLNKFEEYNYLSSYNLKENKEKVYCKNPKIKKYPYHSVKIMDFYSEFYSNGAEVLSLTKEYKLLNGYIRSDALIKFKYDGAIDYVLLEIDNTHNTDFRKLNLYEKAFREYLIQPECEDVDPMVVVVRDNIGLKYRPKNFFLTYMDMKLNNFKSKILEC